MADAGLAYIQSSHPFIGNLVWTTTGKMANKDSTC